MGPLTDDHRCPRARTRRLIGVAAPLVVGGFTGMMVCLGLIDRPHPIVVLFAVLLGGLVADALRRAVVPGV